MKTHLNVTLLLVFFASLSTAAAQEQEDRSAQLEERVAEVRQRLDLTDEQVAQMEPIIESGIEARLLVLEEYGIDPEARASGAQDKLRLRQKRALAKELNEINAEVRDEMSEILTDEQLAEYEKIQEERRAEMRERARARRN